MAIVVLIPTFKRPEALHWSLKSILLQDTQKIHAEEIRVIILNNDVDTKQSVEDSVKKTINEVGECNFKNISIVHRDPPLLGVYNFYNGLTEYTSDGDIAFLHGDDDIMLQGTLVKRYMIAKESSAAFNIVKTSGKIFFFQNDHNIYLGSDERILKNSFSTKWRWAEKDDLIDFSLPFVSAYCYKIGAEFWSCYSQAKKWAENLPLEPKIRLPFLPYYIGLSAWINKQLVVIPEEMVLRGQLFQTRGLLPPRVITEYANTGIILQTGLAVLNNEELESIKELDETRCSLRKSIIPYLFFSLFRRDGVTLYQLSELYRLTKTRWMSKKFFFNIIYYTIITIFRNILLLKHIRNRISGWGTRLESAEFWSKWNWIDFK